MTVTKLGRDEKETLVLKFRAAILCIHSPFSFLVDGISGKTMTAPTLHSHEISCAHSLSRF